MTATVTVSGACPGGFQKGVRVWLRQKVLSFSGTGVWVEPLGEYWVGWESGVVPCLSLQGHSRTLFPRFGGHG